MERTIYLWVCSCALVRAYSFTPGGEPFVPHGYPYPGSLIFDPFRVIYQIADKKVLNLQTSILKNLIFCILTLVASISKDKPTLFTLLQVYLKNPGSLSKVGYAAQKEVAFICGFVVAPWFVLIFLPRVAYLSFVPQEMLTRGYLSVS